MRSSESADASREVAGERRTSKVLVYKNTAKKVNEPVQTRAGFAFVATLRIGLVADAF